MRACAGRLGVPLGSFVVALALASMGGLRSAFPLRQAMDPTHDCMHVFSKEATPESCRGAETGPGGGLVESNCAERAPTDQPGRSRERRLVRQVQVDIRAPNGDFVDEAAAETAAGARDAGIVLQLEGSHSVSKVIRIKDSEPCCHVLHGSLTGTASTSIFIDIPTTRGRAGVATASSRARVRLEADCNGGVTAEQRVEVRLFGILLRDPQGNVLGLATGQVTVDGIQTQNERLRFPDPDLGGTANYAEPFSLEQPPGAGVSQEASGFFEGSHTVRALAAPGADSTTQARGRTRLKFLELFDDDDDVGELQPD